MEMAVEWATVAEESGAAMVAVATEGAMAEEEEAEVEVAEMASRRAAVVATVVVAEGVAALADPPTSRIAHRTLRTILH